MMISNFDDKYLFILQETFQEQFFQSIPEQPKPKKKIKLWVNLLLFIITAITTTQAGVLWLGRDPYDLQNFYMGLPFSVSILLILTFHEFGHFFAAKIHNVEVTLPFYIPFPVFSITFGTMGAVIRMRQTPKTKRALFDIGIAGPVAGYIISVLILIYGFTHLPSVEYLYWIHPEYQNSGIPTSGEFMFSPTLIFLLLGKIFASSPEVFVPPMNEVYHYPFLCAGWFGMLITSLNLLPVGQLDGGHITYALIGSKHKFIARTFFVLVVLMGLVGIISWIFDFGIYANLSMWVVWAILFLAIIKIDHPPIYDNEPIDLKRKLWGWFALFMFVSSFTPIPVISS